jgi:hypothetical protein
MRFFSSESEVSSARTSDTLFPEQFHELMRFLPEHSQ